MAWRPAFMVLFILMVACGASRPTTTPRASQPESESPELRVVFDQSGCRYEGPTSILLTERFTFTLENRSNLSVRSVVAHVPPERLDEVEATIGTEFGWTSEISLRSPSLIAEILGEGEDSARGSVALPGRYVIECNTLAGAEFDRMWRPALIDVVGQG